MPDTPPPPLDFGSRTCVNLGAVSPSVSPVGCGTVKSLYVGIFSSLDTVGGVVGGADVISSLRRSSDTTSASGCCGDDVDVGYRNMFLADSDSAGGSDTAIGGADGGGLLAAPGVTIGVSGIGWPWVSRIESDSRAGGCVGYKLPAISVTKRRMHDFTC